MYKTYCIIAELGAGKSLLTNFFMLKQCNDWHNLTNENVDLYTNMTLYNLPEWINYHHLIDYIDHDNPEISSLAYYDFFNMKNGVCGLDEVDIPFPSQESNREFKKEYTIRLKNLRKENIIMFYNSQSEHLMNVNFRRFTTHIIKCKSEKMNGSHTLKGLVKQYVYERRKSFIEGDFIFYNMEKFYNFYNTNEKIPNWYIPNELLSIKNYQRRRKVNRELFDTLEVIRKKEEKRKKSNQFFLDKKNGKYN